MEHDTEFLSELVLLRNNPQLVVEIEHQARNGNPHAQYAMGLIFAEGRGVGIDLPRSWAWLTLAVMQGDREAETLRNIVGIDLSDDEYRAGKVLAAELERSISLNQALH